MLEYKLFDYQVAPHNRINAALAAGEKEFCLLIGRQWGKTTELGLLGIEKVLAGYTAPDGTVLPANVAYLTKTKRSAKDIARNKFRQLVADAPGSCKFEYKASEEAFVCKKNGGQIVFIGCERESVDLHRGKTWDLILVDEAAFIDDIDEYVADVFGPGTVIRSAPIIYSSTLPKQPKHPFLTILRRCRAKGNVIEISVRDSPCYLTPGQLADAAEKAGGLVSVAFLREYCNEEIYEDADLVIPEWPTVAKAVTLKRDLPRWCNKVIAMDVGFRDLTVVLFSFIDFHQQSLHVQAELVVRGLEALPGPLAKAIQAKTKQLWGENPEYSGKVLRVSDVDPRLLADLQVNHSLEFGAIRKANQGGKAAMIAKFRTGIQDKRVTIDPSCLVLLETLFTAMYSTPNKVDFARDPDIGHADALDAIIYAFWVADFRANPIPKNADPYNPWTTVAPRPEQAKKDPWADVFGKNKKRAL